MVDAVLLRLIQYMEVFRYLTGVSSTTSKRTVNVPNAGDAVTLAAVNRLDALLSCERTHFSVSISFLPFRLTALLFFPVNATSADLFTSDPALHIFPAVDTCHACQ